MTIEDPLYRLESTLRQNFSAVLLLVVLAGCVSGAPEGDSSVIQTSIATQPFGWPFVPPDQLLVRGGITQGAEVSMATPPSPQWLELQRQDLSAHEKDRAAILAMVGTFRASFQFTDVAGFSNNYTPARPYFSWGTEVVHVLEQKTDFISLQHTLVMVFVDESGNETEPMLMKHWRQDWRFEQDNIFLYKGNNHWQKNRLDVARVNGYWTQSVFQVDDSPRYQARGKWQHQGGVSRWYSENFSRPLPRREFSIRDDYILLNGTHSLTLTPSGWVHQQQNDKVAISDNSPGTEIILAQEIGVNRYERINEHELTVAVTNYWDETSGYWSVVRDTWNKHFALSKDIMLSKKVDGISLFQHHFVQAKEFAEGTLAPSIPLLTQQVEAVINSFLHHAPTTNDDSY